MRRRALPELTPFCELRVEVGQPLDLGDDGFGPARIVPILGGTATGPIAGRILSGGTDEQRIGRDGTTRIHARYVIETEGGSLVGVDGQGLRSGPPAVMAALLRGEKVDGSQIYFRTMMRFDTADPALAWINGRIFLSTGKKLPDHVLLQVHQVE